MSLDSSLVLGHSAIDTDHTHFLQLLEQLSSASDSEFPGLFATLLEHTEQHFTREEQLMVKSQYPARDEHVSNHARLLQDFRNFGARVERGRIAFGRSFLADGLARWFPLHITTMDAALVAHLRLNSTLPSTKNTEHGGAHAS